MSDYRQVYANRRQQVDNDEPNQGFRLERGGEIVGKNQGINTLNYKEIVVDRPVQPGLGFNQRGQQGFNQMNQPGFPRMLGYNQGNIYMNQNNYQARMAPMPGYSNAQQQRFMQGNMQNKMNPNPMMLNMQSAPNFNRQMINMTNMPINNRQNNLVYSQNMQQGQYDDEGFQ